MKQISAAVIFFEEDSAMPAGGKPLMLEEIAGRPALSWTAERLHADGVARVLVVASPRHEAQIRACFPQGAALTVSEQQTALMDFLAASDEVLVLPRAALPMAEAGVGFAYTAPGGALWRVWRERMTNAITEATPAAGWLPLFGPETVAELEPLMKARQGR